MPLILPPLEDQRRIVSVLDRKASGSGKVIQSIDRSLQLLEERKAAVIDEALGKESLEAPAVPLKYVAQITDTEHKTAPHLPGGGYWIAGTSSVRQGRILTDALYETDYTSFLGWTQRVRPQPGDIFLTREAPVGEVGLYRSGDPPIAIGQRMVLVRADSHRLMANYLLWVLASRATGRFIELVTQGSLHPHLNMSEIGQIPIPLISWEGQRQVVDFVEHRLAKIDAATASYQRMASLVAERRHALIAALVTGQTDVSAEEVDV
jgi:type I restriction enzyme, S subunit